MEVSNEIKLSMYDAWTTEMEDFQRRVLLARAYHDGNQPLLLSTRQKKFLSMNDDNRYCLNVCRTIVTTLCDELSVIGFDTSEEKKADGKKEQAEFFGEVWTRNKMDMFQSEVHEWGVRDALSFIILEWDSIDKYPVIALHEAWTGENISAWEYGESGVTGEMVEASYGTGVGVFVKWKNNDIMQGMEYAVQYFYQDDPDEKGDTVQIHRRTIYYPNLIIREVIDDNGMWAEYEPPQVWIGKNKQPLGIPVVAFVNKDMRQEAWDVFPQQDAINKTDADILGSSDFFGFPSLWLLGMYPTTDGEKPKNDNSNVIYLQPGQINGNANKSPSEVSVTKMEGSDPTSLMNALKDRIMFVAQITGTPATKFSATAQVASAETLREQKDTLKKRAKNRQVAFGNSWESVMSIARKLSNEFGNTSYDEAVTIETIWKNIETIEELKDEQLLNVPIETIWARLGYSAEKIRAMKNEPSYRLQFMKAFWEGYKSAKENGISIEVFARMVGMDEDDIKLITPQLVTTQTLT